MLETGYRISDLKSIPVTGDACKFRNKIGLDNTYLFGYAHTVYGTTYNRHNYKIPLDTLREDIKGYIGIESITSPWSEGIKLWHGSWENKAIHNKSYVWEWKPEDFSHEHYNPEKFTDLSNSYYIIKDAPFPFETGELNNRDRGEIQAITNNDGSPASINMPIAAADPYPESNKIVTKSYIDERLASKRLIEVTTDFWVRDYDCAYVIRANELLKLNNEENPVIKVHLPKELSKRVAHNKVDFSILIEGESSDGENWKSVLTKVPTWEVYNHLDEQITTSWLNNADNEPVDITLAFLYDNLRYCVLNLEVVADSLTTNPVVENIDGLELTTGWVDSAKLNVIIGCDNFIYRSKGLNSVNGMVASSLNIESADNSIFIDAEQDNSNVNINISTKLIGENGISIMAPKSKSHVLEEGEENGWFIRIKDDFMVGDGIVNVEHDDSDDTFRVSLDTSKLNLNKTHTSDFISGDEIINVEYNYDNDKFELSLDSSKLNIPTNKSYITQVPSNGVIDISKLDESYYLTNPNLNISFNTSNIDTNQVNNITIYYKGTTSSQLNIQNVKWAMRPDNTSPTFIANRLYSITFTFLPSIPNFEEAQIIGKIDWFRY